MSSGGAGGEHAERRRPTLRSVSFAPDPRRLRELLVEVEGLLGPVDERFARQVRLLVGEIVSRVLTSDLDAEIRLDLELKAASLRLDIWQPADEPCGFWEQLDADVFSDLTTAWGQDRRRPCGAWFELDLPDPD